MNPNRPISEVLRFYRLMKNYSQGTVSEILGIKRSTYQAYEEGRSMPLEYLIKLKNIYGLKTVEQFIEMKEPTIPDSFSTKYLAATPYQKKLIDLILAGK